MKTFIGYSNDPLIRNNATSGGVGTALLRYLFEVYGIKSAISFSYASLLYRPELIYKYSDYRITGSIYHDVNLIPFIKDNLSQIKSPFCCFALPCQVRYIKILLKEYEIEPFIISLTCSSQQNFNATEYLLKRLNINPERIENIRYRGKGWPNGITINLKDGTDRFISNINSLWSDISHSRLFILENCFKCKETISEKADICLADPWLKRYMDTEKVGQTLILCNSEEGKNVLYSAKQANYINFSNISFDEILLSQKYTILRKECYRKHKILTRFLKQLCSNPKYRRLALSSSFSFNIHCKLIHILERIFQRTAT